MYDTVNHEILHDSIAALKQAYNLLSNQQHSPDYVTYFFGVAGILGTAITIYALYQSIKSRKLQRFIYKQAQIVLEKEATEEELAKTKNELSNVENRLSDLQRQIQRDLPVEARRAVLKDRLEESLKNLKK